jgi:hypothetical protein
MQIVITLDGIVITLIPKTYIHTKIQFTYIILSM